MGAAARFCANCGQKNTDGRITFKELFSQFLDNLFNFDGRIFQTMAALVVPGKLTESFFEGKHIRYYHPVRLFILSGALFIALVSIAISDTEINKIDKVWENKQKAYFTKTAYDQIDSLGMQIQEEATDSMQVISILDTLKKRFLGKHKLVDLDSAEISDAISFGRDANNMVGKKIALEDLINMKEDSLAIKYGAEGVWNRLVFIQNIRIQKSTKSFFFYMIGNVLWMILIMMPMLALAMKLLYLRKTYLYIEHLIFSFHTHTFAFILYALAILFYKLTNVSLFNFLLLVVAGYLLMAMKRFYKEKWWLTIVKFIVANIFYFIVFVLASLLMTMTSLFMF